MGKLLSKLRKDDDDDSSSGSKSTLKDKANSMQEVLKDIWMGPESVAKNKDLLKKHGITHILAIGWDLKAWYPEDFKYKVLEKVEDRPGYLLIQHFRECFKFMDDCLEGPSNIARFHRRQSTLMKDLHDVDSPSSSSSSSSSRKKLRRKSKKSAMDGDSGRNKLFVHCHKGLSRSASIIIAYEMKKHKENFVTVYNTIRKVRSFIMPNIGFQAQLKAFEEKNFSTDINDYTSLDIHSKISHIIPDMLKSIKKTLQLYRQGKGGEVDTQEMFEITMYFHQVDMLDRSGRLTNPSDTKILEDAIASIRQIQIEFICDDDSLRIFDKMFKLDSSTGKRVFKKRKGSEKTPSVYVEGAADKEDAENENELKSNEDENGDEQDEKMDEKEDDGPGDGNGDDGVDNEVKNDDDEENGDT